MPKKKYVVDLSAEERATLEHLLRSGKTGARKLTRARMLLKAWITASATFGHLE
jgi:hypothetical protein